MHICSALFWAMFPKSASRANEGVGEGKRSEAAGSPRPRERMPRKPGLRKSGRAVDVAKEARAPRASTYSKLDGDTEEPERDDGEEGNGTNGAGKRKTRSSASI